MRASVGWTDASSGAQLSLGYCATVSWRTRRLEAHCLKVPQGFAPMVSPGLVPRASWPHIAQETATISDMALAWRA
jgi:hypothetical protein